MVVSRCVLEGSPCGPFKGFERKLSRRSLASGERISAGFNTNPASKTCRIALRYIIQGPLDCLDDRGVNLYVRLFKLDMLAV